jgi:hypothetical protein
LVIAHDIPSLSDPEDDRPGVTQSDRTAIVVTAPNMAFQDLSWAVSGPSRRGPEGSQGVNSGQRHGRRATLTNALETHRRRTGFDSCHESRLIGAALRDTHSFVDNIRVMNWGEAELEPEVGGLGEQSSGASPRGTRRTRSS